VQFDENINDTASTLTKSSFSIGTGSVDSVGTGNTADDDTIVLTVSGLTGTGSAQAVSVTPAAGAVVDDAGNGYSSGQFSGTTDGAAPYVEGFNAVSTASGLKLSLNASESLKSSSGVDLVLKDSQGDTRKTFSDPNGGTANGDLTKYTFSYDGTGTFDATLNSVTDTNSNQNTDNLGSSGGKSELTANVQTGLLKSAKIEASPNGQGLTAQHNVTFTLASSQDVTTYEIAYPYSSPTPINSVGPDDIVALGIDKNGDGKITADSNDVDFTNDSSVASGINNVNGGDGKVLTVGTGSSVTLPKDTPILLKYKDAVNPDSTSADVTLRLDPDTPDAEAVRTLSTSADVPQVNQFHLGGTLVYDGSIQNGNDFGRNLNGSTHLNVTFDQSMSSAGDIALHVGGQTLKVTGGTWDGNQYEGNLESPVSVSGESVTANVTVDGATEDDNGNEIQNFQSSDFTIDAAPLGIKAAKTYDDQIDGTANDNDVANTVEIILNDSVDDSDSTLGSAITIDGNTISSGNIQTGSNVNQTGTDDQYIYVDAAGAGLGLNSSSTPTVSLAADKLEDDEGNPSVKSSVTAMDGIAPDLSHFDLRAVSGQTVNVSVDSNEQVANLTVQIKDDSANVVKTLSDFDESESSGTYNYTTNVDLGTDGTFTAHVVNASDDSGNHDATVGATGSLDVDTTGPTISPDDHGANATISGQSDIDVSITDAVHEVNAKSIYVSIEDSSGTILDRGRVSAVSDLSYDSGANMLTIQSESGDNFAYATGDVTVTVEATDTVSHESSKSWTFTYADPSTEITADGDSVKVNVTTQATFDNATATVEASNSLDSEDGKPTYTLDLSGTQKSGNYYYTATQSDLRDGQYTVTAIDLNNSATSNFNENPGVSDTVNTSLPYVTHAVISSYDGDAAPATKITVWLSEPVSEVSDQLDGSTFYVEGHAAHSVVSQDLASGKVVLTNSTEIQTGDKPKITVNEAGDLEELHATGEGAAGNLNASSSTAISTVDMKLSAGPNFVSIPAASGEYDLSNGDSSVVSKIDAVWRYDNGQWQSWDPDKPAGENDFHTVQGGQGYVFVMDSSATASWSVNNVVGGDTAQEATPGTTDLEEGWNLVGQWQEGQQKQAHALDSLNNWDSSTRVYAQANAGSWTPTVYTGNFKPGEAYWVFVSDDDTYKESNSWDGMFA